MAQTKLEDRLDILEAAWEKLLDMVNSNEHTAAVVRNQNISDFASIKEDILTLRDAVMVLEGKENEKAAEANKAILEDLPEFATEEEAATYAREELAKGNRSETIRKWLDELEGETDV